MYRLKPDWRACLTPAACSSTLCSGPRLPGVGGWGDAGWPPASPSTLAALCPPRPQLPPARVRMLGRRLSHQATGRVKHVTACAQSGGRQGHTSASPHAPKSPPQPQRRPLRQARRRAPVCCTWSRTPTTVGSSRRPRVGPLDVCACVTSGDTLCMVLAVLGIVCPTQRIRRRRGCCCGKSLPP